MYSLIEYSDNYSKTSENLWQHHKDEPNNNTEDSQSFKSKVKIMGKTPNDGNSKNVQTIVPLKYLSNFWRILEMLLINCETNLILSSSIYCVVTNSSGAETCEITETKLYVAVVTLSTQDNSKLLQQLKSGFKRTISRNRYESNIKTFAQNRYLNHLIIPSFQGMNTFFVLSFENESDRTSHSNYYLPRVEIKDYNVMIKGKDFLDEPISSNIKTYENIRSNSTGQGDDYTTGCLLDYSYCKGHCKMI